MYAIEINFGGEWLRPTMTFTTVDDAEWYIAAWKQANNYTKDISFRTAEIKGKSSRRSGNFLVINLDEGKQS